jgi:hypothetical protein
MSGGDETELLLTLRQSNVKPSLTPSGAFKEILKGKGGLPGAWFPLDQIQPVRIQPPTQHVVEPGDARAYPGLIAPIAQFVSQLALHRNWTARSRT